MRRDGSGTTGENPKFRLWERARRSDGRGGRDYTERDRGERGRQGERGSPEKDSSPTFVMKSVFLSPPRPRPSLEFLLTLYCSQRKRDSDREWASGVALKVVGHRDSRESGGWRGWSPRREAGTIRYASQRIEPLRKRKGGRRASRNTETNWLNARPRPSVNAVTLPARWEVKWVARRRRTAQRLEGAYGSFLVLVRRRRRDGLYTSRPRSSNHSPAILHLERRFSPGKIDEVSKSEPDPLNRCCAASLCRR